MTNAKKLKRNSMLSIALSYIRQGLSIVPLYPVKGGKCDCGAGKKCLRPGKHPRTKHGVKDATTSTKKVKAHWKKYPDDNIGVSTGSGSGVMVLDVDLRNGGEASFAAALRTLGKLPKCPKSLTPSGGYHLLFSPPKAKVKSHTSGKVLGAGVDVLSTGSYFVAPGSTGLKGKYRWAKGRALDEIKLPKLPKSWVSALTSSTPVTTSTRGNDAIIPEGSRNTTLTSMAGSMRRAGIPEDSIMAALLSHNKGCSPPLAETEVRGIVDSVCSLYPEGSATGDTALQLAHGVLANHFCGGRNLIVEQGRFWSFETTHWVEVPDAWIKKKVLQTIQDFRIKVGTSTSALLEQSLQILKAELTEVDNRIAAPDEAKPVINTQGGELWIAADGSVTLKPHDPASYLTHCLKITYDPAATCPMFDAALAGIFSKAESPAEMVRHWQELMGYIIQPERNIATIGVCTGGGSNGKTKLIGTIVKLLGDHLVNAQPIGSFEGSRFLMASLFGKLLLLDDDVNANTRIPDGFLKTISEGKVVTGDVKYKSPLTFRVRAFPMLLCNNPPSSADLSWGMQRRLMVMPFDKQFKGKAKDTTLFDRIWATELPGVLNRALEGLARLRQRGTGFLLPKDVRKANKKFLIEANPLPAFIDECCTVDIGASMYLKDFYTRYQDWCVDGGITMKQQKSKVKKNLENLGYQFGRGSNGPKVMGVRIT
jgi:putative DNA primase/helicase